tara:strand:+ start:935 stop:1249 length:315 start_codon:yes stop_codon:yes gene_type:complete
MKRGECIKCGHTWPESEPDTCPKCSPRLVSIIRRKNYRVIEHIGGWHQNIVADVIRSDGSSEAGRQATIYTFDYPAKQDCINDAQRIADFFNANANCPATDEKR